MTDCRWHRRTITCNTANAADTQLQIGRDDEQHHEHDARQHRFDDASRTSDGVDHGKIVSITGVGKRTKTGSFFRFSFSHTY